MSEQFQTRLKHHGCYI